MGDPSQPIPNLPEVCPYGILNLAAALETHMLLLTGTDAVHRRLRDWLAEKYLEGNIRLLYLAEPLGRRIRSVEDLGMIVSAYGRARALRRPKSSEMDNELYFYGQEPAREAAVAAGKPDVAPGRIAMVNEPVASRKGVKWAEPLVSVHEVREDDPVVLLKGAMGEMPLYTIQEVSEEG
jgi:hypothetical protein